MKEKAILIFALLIPVLVSGCASRASAIPPVAVTSTDYQRLSCDKARALLSEKREIEIALTKKQNNAAVVDAVAVYLVLLPLGSVLGADREGDLAIAKGEVNALERKISVDC